MVPTWWALVLLIFGFGVDVGHDGLGIAAWRLIMAYIIEVGGWIDRVFGLGLGLVAAAGRGWHLGLATGSVQEDRWGRVGHVGVLFWR